MLRIRRLRLMACWRGEGFVEGVLELSWGATYRVLVAVIIVVLGWRIYGLWSVSLGVWGYVERSLARQVCRLLWTPYRQRTCAELWRSSC